MTRLQATLRCAYCRHRITQSLVLCAVILVVGVGFLLLVLHARGEL